jgi:hypothetical protein
LNITAFTHDPANFREAFGECQDFDHPQISQIRITRSKLDYTKSHIP